MVIAASTPVAAPKQFQYLFQPTVFIWAVGIENTFIPQARPGLRPLDEFELTQHYDLWQADLDRVASLGVTHLRWGPPWYRLEPERGRFDWSWTDRVLEYMVSVKGLTPILDLMHYGTPFWLERSFADPDYPCYVADYAAAFAERYRGLVSCYTPFNEPLVAAEFCGQRGVWPPYLKGDHHQAYLLLQLARGQQLTMGRLRQLVPGCILVAVEALTWHYGAAIGAQSQAEELHDFRFISFDLVTGRLDPAGPAYRYLLAAGAGEIDIEAILLQAQPFDCFGVNFYPWSGGELIRQANGSYTTRPGSLTGRHLEHVLALAYRKTNLPLMVTETSARRDISGRTTWLDETLAAVAHCRARALPVIGYTWFPVFTMIDWAYRTDRRPIRQHLLHLGLWESSFDKNGVLQRHSTTLVNQYRDHVTHPLV